MRVHKVVLIAKTEFNPTDDDVDVGIERELERVTTKKRERRAREKKHFFILNKKKSLQRARLEAKDYNVSRENFG